MSVLCKNNAADRRLGRRWEEHFCDLGGQYGKMFTAHQIGRTESARALHRLNGRWHPLTLPDVTIWSEPGEHHEIKHKDPCKGGRRRGRIGLEVYRFRSLVGFANELPRSQGVFYTIHRHDLAPGGRAGDTNRMQDWFTVDVHKLQTLNESGKVVCEPGKTYYAGGPKIVDIFYWPFAAWQPLVDLWKQHRFL